MSFSNALAGRIRVSVNELSPVIERMASYLSKALASNDQAHWDALALNLHGFYSGIEQIFEDIARTMDGSLPTWSEWHIDLLIQMASEMKGSRPAVIRPRTHACLDEYRGFRQVVVYGMSTHSINDYPGSMN